MLRRFLLVALLVVSGASLVVAEQTGDAKPEKKAEKAAKVDKPAAKPMVYGEYKELTLTDEQQGLISTIQKETKEKIKQLQDDERSRILALLKPDQREALDKIEAEKKAKDKERGEAYRNSHKKDAPATQPAEPTKKAE